MNKNLPLDLSKTIETSAPAVGFEFSENQIARMRTVGEVTLALSILAGTITLTVLAPNIFLALDKLFGKKQHGSKKVTLEKRKQQLKRSFYYLRDQDYIEIKKENGFISVSPTKKGKRRMNKIAFRNLKINKPKKWSGSWWVVLADIPSKKFRHQAYYFQKKLKAMGLYPLQRTVWVHPFDPREEVESSAAHFRINPFITIMEVKRLDPNDEENLKNHFHKTITS
jgi:hypothetical protein